MACLGLLGVGIRDGLGENADGEEAVFGYQVVSARIPIGSVNWSNGMLRFVLGTSADVQCQQNDDEAAAQKAAREVAVNPPSVRAGDVVVRCQYTT